MGTSQSQFSNIGSTLVDLGNNFATTEKPIMEMAHRMAGAGKQVGLTEAQVLGFAAALSSVGIEAQMGGSAFSKALIKMEVASATGGDALEDFGRVAGMTAQQFKTLWDSDPAAAFEAFIVGLSKLDDEGESAIAMLDEIGIKEVRLRDTMLRAVIASYLKGSGKVAFANRPGGFYFARIVNQIPFEKILRGNPHRSFAVNFRCKPFWYQENVPEITVTTSGTFVNNPGSVYSEPVITVHGSGEITLMVGMTIVELDGITDSITLDSPLMEAYQGVVSMNSCMSGDFPTLLPGQNAISWTGNVTKVVIQPNWRYL